MVLLVEFWEMLFLTKNLVQIRKVFVILVGEVKSAVTENVEFEQRDKKIQMDFSDYQ